MIRPSLHLLTRRTPAPRPPEVAVYPPEPVIRVVREPEPPEPPPPPPKWVRAEEAVLGRLADAGGDLTAHIAVHAPHTSQEGSTAP